MRWSRLGGGLGWIYGHGGKRRRYQRLINGNYPQDTPGSIFQPCQKRGECSLRVRVRRTCRAPILISPSVRSFSSARAAFLPLLLLRFSPDFFSFTLLSFFFDFPPPAPTRWNVVDRLRGTDEHELARRSCAGSLNEQRSS